MNMQDDDRYHYELLRQALRDRFGSTFGRTVDYHHELCWNVYLASSMSIATWDEHVDAERRRLVAKR